MMVKANGNSITNRKYYTKCDFYPALAIPKTEEDQSYKLVSSTDNVDIFDTEDGLMMNVKVAPNRMNNMLPLLRAKEEKLNKVDDLASEKTFKTDTSENKYSGTKRKKDDVDETIEKAIKRKKTESTFLNKKSYELQSDKRYSDLGGIAEIVEELKRLVLFPLKHPEVFEYLGADPPRGILL
jgi:SpoVK/Ycf46/Vps4 family AAA+-type ATPase